MAPKKSLNVAVIGAAGMTGSYTVVELLNRGHTVAGISRNPGAIGKDERYTPIPLDFDNSSISDIAKAFSGFDVIVK
jgi:putative NADH-flavin reductase